MVWLECHDCGRVWWGGAEATAGGLRYDLCVRCHSPLTGPTDIKEPRR